MKIIGCYYNEIGKEFKFWTKSVVHFCLFHVVAFLQEASFTNDWLENNMSSRKSYFQSAHINRKFFSPNVKIFNPNGKKIKFPKNTKILKNTYC